MRRIALIVVVLLAVLVLGVGQLVLPGIAAHQLRDRLSQYGTVGAVHVHAFPAIKLLWHHADRVDIALASYHSDSGRAGSFLGSSGQVGTLNVTVASVQIGLLRLRAATLTKRGQNLSASAKVSESDLTSAVPFLQDVRPVASGRGALTFQGTVGAFGLGVTADATVAVQDGALVVTPDLPLGGLAPITLFSNPQVTVQSVSASQLLGGFSVSAHGRLS